MKTALFGSLKHRDFRFFFSGQAVSMIGTWIQITTLPWLAYRLSSSIPVLWAIGFINPITLFLFSPLSGAAADHYNKRRILIVTQSLAMAQAIILAALTLSGKIEISHIIMLSAFLGIVNAFDMPARQSFLIEMVGKNDLMNAISLNSLLVNTARLISPFIAGSLIAISSEGECFFINGLSFTAAITALLFISKEKEGFRNDKISITEKMVSGIRYVRTSKSVLSLLLITSVTGFVSILLISLMPVFARDVYHKGPQVMGLMVSCTGIGAVIGNLRVAFMKQFENMDSAVIKSAVLFCLSTLLFSLSTNIQLSVMLLISAGYYMAIQVSLSNTQLQLLIPDAMRGRAMGFFSMAFLIFVPLGSVLSGYFANIFSAPAAMAGAALLCCAVVILLRFTSIVMPNRRFEISSQELTDAKLTMQN